jgi:8-oxo-dGTP pyrophosphatase MutT (NUDIX family)
MIQTNMRRMLSDYLFTHPDTQNARILREMIAGESDVFARGQSLAHITASGWVLSKGRTKALLIEHALHRIFVVPGGHVDPGETALQAAIREVGEEAGLTALTVLMPTLFDLDIHKIPARDKKGEPEHWHIDVRFALWNSNGQGGDFNKNECLSAKWASVIDLSVGADQSLKRMAQKSLEIF